MCFFCQFHSLTSGKSRFYHYAALTEQMEKNTVPSNVMNPGGQKYVLGITLSSNKQAVWSFKYIPYI